MEPQHGSREQKYDAERRSADHHHARNPARWPESLRRGKRMRHLVPTFRSSYTLTAPTFHELRKVTGTSNFIFLVPLSYLKFLYEFAACGAGTSNRRH